MSSYSVSVESSKPSFFKKSVFKVSKLSISDFVKFLRLDVKSVDNCDAINV